MKHIQLLLVITQAFFYTFNLNAQNLKLCGADELRISTLQANPEIAKAVVKTDRVLEAFTIDFIQNLESYKVAANPYIIPVVFHVIHNNGSENISEAQIINSIEVLNQRFSRTSPDTGQIVAAFKPLHADCEIEFRIAGTDPDGFCTNGINRIESTLTSTGDHSVKDLIQWPPEMYLNIYVVKNAAGLAGHAVWPSDADTIPTWDGIVIAHEYVGSIGTSSTQRSVVLAHEAGHYLNLHHIWGGNNVPGFYFLPCADPNKDCTIDDYVADTPPTIGWQSCNLNGTTCDTTLDNVQNMMEYSYCNKMFTHGQKDLMHACLNSTIAGRSNLHTTANLMATGVFDTSNVNCFPLGIQNEMTSYSFEVFPNPTKGFITLLGAESILKNSQIIMYNTLGKKQQIQRLSVNQYDVSHLPRGVYFIEMTAREGMSIVRKLVVNP